MAACIVCNQPTIPTDIQDAGDILSLCARLEKVLNETVPQGSVMCSSCQCDLAQIEMYYILLIAFKKRYSETAKQRSQSREEYSSRNLLQQTSSFSSNMLQLETSLEISPPDIKPEIHNVTEDLQALIKEPSYDSSAAIVISPKKRGRPRKNQQAARSTVKEELEGDESIPVLTTNIIINDALETSIQHSKQPGRPRKFKHLSESLSEGSEKDQYCEDLGSDESFLGEQSTDESDKEDSTFDPKQAPLTPSMGNKPGDAGSRGVSKSSFLSAGVAEAAPAKKKRGGPRKERDPIYVSAPVQTKRGRPKKSDPRQSFSCSLCEKTFTKGSRLNVHMRMHTRDRPYACSLCDKSFKSNGDLKSHMQVHLEDKPFKCDICTRSFRRKSALQRHLIVHTEDQPFQCDQCQRKFKGERNLIHHIKAHHSDSSKYLCSICGLALLTEASLRNHIKTHSDARPFTCETCGQGFSTKTYLLNHELTHKPDTREKYLCPICGKALLQKSYLPLHMKQHTGESKHICSICHRSFSTSSGHKYHMTTHSDEKPYRCSECGKGFAGKGNLKAHMMSHTDERPHKCSCGQGFRSKVGMQKHMRANKYGCGGNVAGSGSSKRQLSHSASVPTEAPVSSAALPVTHPPPVAAPPAIAEQRDLLSAYQIGPLYLGL